MSKYSKIENLCQDNQKISAELIDDYLIYYAAAKDKLEPLMQSKFSKFRHITDELPVAIVNTFKSQFIAHRIFKEGGLVRKYLNHSEIKLLPDEQKEYLSYAEKHPWRFSFSKIIDSPHENFYRMKDVFHDEEFLLYSPGTTRYLSESPAKLWFNLIGFNGACWQSYGPIAGYQSFETEDIHFFAWENNEDLMAETEDVMADVEQDPLPYMMLICGALYPIAVKDVHQTVECLSEYDIESPDLSVFHKYFNIEQAGPIHKFSIKDWDTFPHFSTAYYDEEEKLLVLYAMTDIGFGALVKKLRDLGLDISPFPDFRVNPSMKVTAEKILRKEVSLNRYETFFKEEPSEANKESLEKINEYMAAALPLINEGKFEEATSLAEDYGLPKESIVELLSDLRKKLGR